MKENKLNNLEQKLNDKLNSASFEFQDSHWAEVEGKIAKKGGFFSGSKWFKMAAVILIGAAGIYYIYDNDDLPENKFTNEENSSVEPTKIIEVENTEIPSEKPNNNTTDPNNKNINANETKPVLSNSKNETEVELITDVDETIDLDLELNRNPEIILPEEQEEIILSDLNVDGNYCIGNTLRFVAITDIETEVNLNWKVNGQDVVHSGTEFNLLLENAGTYEIEVMSNSGQTQKKIIEVNELPIINFTYEDLADPFWDEAAILKAEPLLENYSWEIEGMENAIIGNNQTIDFASTGFFDVELIYTDQNGCKTSISKPVQIQENFDPLAPTAFTPDGDGLNDDFIPHGFGEIDADFRMSIFDIKGNLIYTTTSLSEPWKGQENSNSTEHSPNLYVWKVEIRKENKIKAYTGQVQQYRSFK